MKKWWKKYFGMTIVSVPLEKVPPRVWTQVEADYQNKWGPQ